MFQCEEYTKSGRRCKKRTKNNTMCHIHWDQRKRRMIQEENEDVVISAPNEPIHETITIITMNPPVPIPEPISSDSSADSSSRAIRTRSVTRLMMENALQTYRRGLLGNQQDIQRLIELEMERERIMNDLRVREPPRRPRKPVKRRRQKDSQEEPIETYKGQVEDCCVCSDCQVKDLDFLECKHAVCKECVGNLRDPRCPMCRAVLKARFITDKDIRKMKAKVRQDRMERAEESFRNYLRQDLPLMYSIQ